MPVPFSGPVFPLSAGFAEFAQVGDGEFVQLSTGLDEQPRRHLRAGGEADPVGETERCRFGHEPIHVRRQPCAVRRMCAGRTGSHHRCWRPQSQFQFYAKCMTVCRTARATLCFVKTIAFRPDAESAQALSLLTRDGSTSSAAIRRALIAAADQELRAELLEEAEAVAADQSDRQEARRVLQDMEHLRAW